VVLCDIIAYMIVPRYSCNENLKSCNQNVPFHAEPGEECCSKESNWGWRYLVFIVGALTISCFLFRFVIFKFQESPKFLLSKGRDQQAVEALQYIAKYNNQETSISLKDFSACTPSPEELDQINGNAATAKAVSKNRIRMYLQHSKGLFSTWAAARITLTIWTIYVS